MSLPQVVACPWCGKNPKDQHSCHESGICDGLRSGKIRKIPGEKGKAQTYEAVQHEVSK